MLVRTFRLAPNVLVDMTEDVSGLETMNFRFAKPKPGESAEIKLEDTSVKALRQIFADIEAEKGR